jgi:hypothetical protein
MKLSSLLLVAGALVVCGLPLAGQSTGTLKAKVDPGRAGVFLDGKYLGPAANFRHARSYKVAAGEHDLKLVDPRYEDVAKKVTIEAGKKTEVRETMKALPLVKPPFGMIHTISSDKFAAVYLNGKYYGHAGEFNCCVQALLVPPGEYEVRIEPANGPAVTKKITVVAKKTVTVE